MKLGAYSDAAGPRLHPAAAHARALAFTLTELIICTALFVMLVGGVVTANLFGLRMFQVTEIKLKASDSVRKAIGQLADEIRSCSTTVVGNIVTNTGTNTFVGVADGVVQTGMGLMIFPSTNSGSYILYFVNPSDRSFRRTTDISGTTTVLARSVTNASGVFRVQDHLGNVLTNSQNNRVIHTVLEFYQASRFTMAADYYKLETSVTRRATDQQ